MPFQKYVAFQTLLLSLNLHEQEQIYQWWRTKPIKRVGIVGKYGTKGGALPCRTIKKIELIQHRRYTCTCSLFYTSSRRSMLIDHHQQRGGGMWPPLETITFHWMPIPEPACPCSGPTCQNHRMPWLQCELSPLCYEAPFPGVWSTIHPLSRLQRLSTELLKAAGVQEISPTWLEVLETPPKGYRWLPGDSHHFQIFLAAGLSSNVPILAAGWLYKPQLQSTPWVILVSTLRSLPPRYGILFTSSPSHQCLGVPQPRSSEGLEEEPWLRFWEGQMEILSSWEEYHLKRGTTHLHKGLKSICKPHRDEPSYHVCKSTQTLSIWTRTQST